MKKLPTPNSSLLTVFAFASAFCAGSAHALNLNWTNTGTDFNANFLALPALPSKVVANASADKDIVARVIDAGAKDKWVFAVNTSPNAKTGVTINFGAGKLQPLSDSAAKGTVTGASVKIDLRPYQLVSFKL